ncbi:MAG: hypothetical protein HND52_19115 [Ignavibacteriae bacterium]|nr:hypothetical protein [Ignavibacteriota bacterium]NOH00077.1 hypothetical protein [Ignavibacteriota bacterium]
MENIKNLTTQKLQEEITNEDLRNLKIIISALNIGVLLFFAVCLFLYFSGDQQEIPKPVDIELIDTLLMLSLGLTVLMIIVSRVVPDQILRNNSKMLLADRIDEYSIVNKLLGVATTHYIIKFAMLEGAALFGLVTLILSVLNNSIHYNSVYWLAILPMLVMNFIFILTFPSKERVIQLISDKILLQKFG